MSDLQRVLADTEDFLVRQVGTRSGRVRNGQRLRRGLGEAMRRLRRAALVFVFLLFALIAWNVAGNEVGWTWLIAVPAMFLAALVSLMFPTRGARPPEDFGDATQKLAAMRLDTLAERCGAYLSDRSNELPRDALAPADTILARLHDLQPHLAALPDGAPVAGEIRRLVGGHLPRLVDSWMALPPDARDPRSENGRRIAESLGLVAQELSRLCDDLDGCRNSAFETEHRFIETRYKDDGLLDG